MNKDNKFYCEICNYKCNFLSHYNQHLETIKHKNNGKIIRKCFSKEKKTTKCKLCKFETNHSSNLKVHILAYHSNIEEKKDNSKYYCELCNFGTFTKILYERHCETIKHKNKII